MIEVGELIRTKQGYIYKVKSVHEDMIWVYDTQWIPEQEIVKHSKNLIDLIEERRLCKWRTNYRYKYR